MATGKSPRIFRSGSEPKHADNSRPVDGNKTPATKPGKRAK